MHHLTVLFFTLGLSTLASSKLCVLERMVTVHHPRCREARDCAVEHTVPKRHSKRLHIRLQRPGSAGLSHYESVKPNDPVVMYDEARSGFNDSVTCDEKALYRTYSGLCNNLDNPDWGRVNKMMVRFLPARYNESNAPITTSVMGRQLPEARFISSTIFPDVNKPSPKYTLLVMQWGQIVAHDSGKSPDSTAVDCCGSNLDECYPIEIPPNDPFYSQFNQTCMTMARSSFDYIIHNCSRMRTPIAAVSQILDLSPLYGSNTKNADSLRQFQGGRLLGTETSEGEFPIISMNPLIDCNTNETCFVAGDTRVNQNTQLTAVQVLLLRMHNKFADTLSVINPKWDDETLYQETRKICIAVYQHITYKEWIPVILGNDYVTKYNLRPLTHGYTKYNKNLNPSTLLSFMSSAYRSFHSNVQGNVWMVNASRCPFASINMSDWMNRPGILMEDDNLDSFLVGLTVEPQQKLDRYFTTQITEMMFHGDLPYGQDLESFDIQRGRDHGLPSYNTYRQLCKTGEAQTFSDLLSVMSEKHIELLQRVYTDVDDVEFFVGGMLETPVKGLAVGPTFLCILGEQFIRKKFGDRFWYEAGGMQHSFTPDQLQEIRKSTYSKFLCDNSNNITHVQPNSFLQSSEKGNGVVPCSTLPGIDFSKWKDTL